MAEYSPTNANAPRKDSAHNAWQRLLSFVSLHLFPIGAVLFFLGQLLCENWLLHSAIGIPEQDLALVPLIHRWVQFNRWVPFSRPESSLYSLQTALIVIQPSHTNRLSERCSLRSRLKELLQLAPASSRAVVIDIALDPSERCDNTTQELKDAIKASCAVNGVTPVVLGISPLEPSLSIGGEKCRTGSLQLPTDLSQIPIQFVNPDAPRDSLAMALATVLIPDAVPAVEVSKEASVYLKRERAWPAPKQFDDEDVLKAFNRPPQKGFPYQKIKGLVWVIGSARDKSFRTTDGTKFGYELQHQYVEALLNPRSYVRGLPPLGGIFALVGTALWLWTVDKYEKKTSSMLPYVIMGGGILGILLFDALLIALGWYSDWTSVSILTLLAWFFHKIKDTPWVSKMFDAS